MLLPPLNYTDLSWLLIVGSIVIFFTIEIISPYYGATNLLINKSRLRKVAYTTGILFFLILAIRMIIIFGGI
jgi:hypothetical protein